MKNPASLVAASPFALAHCAVASRSRSKYRVTAGSHGHTALAQCRCHSSAWTAGSLAVAQRSGLSSPRLNTTPRFAWSQRPRIYWRPQESSRCRLCGRVSRLRTYAGGGRKPHYRVSRRSWPREMAASLPGQSRPLGTPGMPRWSDSGPSMRLGGAADPTRRSRSPTALDRSAGPR